MSAFMQQVAEYSVTPINKIVVDEGFRSEAELEIALRDLYLNMSDYNYAHTLCEKGINKPINLVETNLIQVDKFDGIQDFLNVSKFEPVYQDEEEKLQEKMNVYEKEEKDSEVIRGSIPTPSELKYWNDLLASEGLGLIF